MYRCLTACARIFYLNFRTQQRGPTIGWRVYSQMVGRGRGRRCGALFPGVDLPGDLVCPLREEYDFGTVNLIMGVNGVGKTSPLESIEFLFCGRVRRPDCAPTRTSIAGESPSYDVIVRAPPLPPVSPWDKIQPAILRLKRIRSGKVRRPSLSVCIGNCSWRQWAFDSAQTRNRFQNTTAL